MGRGGRIVAICRMNDLWDVYTDDLQDEVLKGMKEMVESKDTVSFLVGSWHHHPKLEKAYVGVGWGHGKKNNQMSGLDHIKLQMSTRGKSCQTGIAREGVLGRL